MKTDCLALLFLTTVLADPIFGQSKTTTFDSSPHITFRIYVSVSAPAMIQNVIESGMLRRLREFKDIEIVHSVNPTSSPMSGVFAFYVTAIQVKNNDEDQTGYAIAVASTDSDPLDVAKALAYEDQKKIAGQIVDALHGETAFRALWIYTCGLKDLNNLLDTIVADIDTKIFEPTREQIKETLRKFK
jgi:hypothetical protein